MSSTNTPNMNLIIPGVGTEAGPTYAEDVNASLIIIDQHTHAAGSGVPITNDGININAALTLNSNFLIDAAGVTLVSQSTPPGVGTVYRVDDDLFYIDGLGNEIQITDNGAVAGTPGSIANLVSPASASYVALSQTFVWQSGASIAANMDAGSILLRNLTPNSTFALTLQPPAALGSNYSVTLPVLPVSQKIMTLDSAGTMSAPYTVDGSTIVIATNVIGVPTGGITATQLGTDSVITAKIQDAAVTSAKLAAALNITGSQIAAGTITGSNLTSDINLPGNHVQENGLSVIVSSADANPSLKMIRGTWNGAALSVGEGVSASLPGGNVVRLTWGAAFSASPVVVISLVEASDPASSIIFGNVVSTSACDVRNSVSNTAAAFSFIAIGPR